MRPIAHLLLASAVITFLMLAITTTARAATFIVPNTNDSGGGSLRDAIEDANSRAGADQIEFDDGLSGTITLASALPAATDLDGLAIDGGGDVTVRGSNTERIFGVTGGAELVLRNLTLLGGTANRGGGILNDGTLEIINSKIYASDADQGGGIYNYRGANVTITESTLSGNNANYGGGIYNYGGSIKLVGSTLADNFSPNSIVSSGDGGGIYNYDGTITIIDSTLSDNSTTAGSGGGILNNNGTLEVANSTLSNNSASDAGGGIASEGTVAVINSTLSDNRAHIGGGINNYGRVNVSHSTLSGNSADSDGGSGIATYGEAASATLRTTILANNAAGGNCAGIASGAAVTDGGFNVDDFDTCSFTQANNSISNTDPLLDPDGLQDNGGPTPTIALQPDSPAVDLVEGDACPRSETDQRGVDRPQGTACDIGAFELKAPGPWARLRPPAHNYGDQVIGASSFPQSFILENTGAAALRISEADMRGVDAGEFTKTSDKCSRNTLAPTERCTVKVSFSPTSTGIKEAQLVIKALRLRPR